jgi:uncharacterized membrane protein
VFSMVWGVLFGMLLVASLGFLFSLIALALRLVELGFFLLWLFLMYKAYKNERCLAADYRASGGKTSGHIRAI